MSTRAQVIAAMSKGTKRAPATWERITGNLGNAGYTQKGRPGGGIGAAHYTLGPLASVLMASSALNPSDAAETVARLEGLRATPPSTPLTDDFPPAQPTIVQPGTTLRDYVEQEITSWSAPSAEMLEVLANDRFHNPLWQLDLSPDFPSARLIMHRTNHGWCSKLFFPEQFPETDSQSGFSVTTKLPLSLFKIAGDLLRDTLARQTPSLITPSLLDSSDGDPDENAALPGAASTRDQDQNSIPGTQNTPKGKREKRKTQASSSPGSGHPFHPEREITRVRNPRETAFDHHFGM